jgi:curved DNA-binding protein CbpA
MPDLKPTESGRLAAKPLVQLLINAADQRFTGTLVLEVAPDKRNAVYFHEGHPAKAKLSAPVHLLGELLVERGRIDSATHQVVVAAATRERRRYGQLLLERGQLTQEELEEALKEQLLRKVDWLVRLGPDTTYGFFASNLLENWGARETHPVSVLAALWRIVKSHASAQSVTNALVKLTERTLKLHPAAQVNRFGFDRKEQALVDVLRAKPMTPQELIATGLLEELTAKKIVYVLALTRQFAGRPDQVPVGAANVQRPPTGERRREARTVDGIGPQPRVSGDASLDARVAGERPSPIAPPTALPEHATSLAERLSLPDLRPQPIIASTPHEATPAPARAARKTQEYGGGAAPRPAFGSVPDTGGAPKPWVDVDALRAELKARADKLEELDFYALLGVDRLSTPLVVQGAFFALAKRWHPDKLPPELEDMKAVATRLFARVTEAHATLSDGERRKQYDEVLKSGGNAAEQEEVARALRAATAYQRAEILFKKNNLVAAEKEAQVAYEGDPEQADHIALYAWILAQKPERNESGKFDDLLVMLDKAVTLSANNLRARFYRGMLLKRAGRMNKAIKDFRFVVEKNPNHVDAAREVRLFEIRKNEAAKNESPAEKPAEGGGLFGRLFKR